MDVYSSRAAASEHLTLARHRMQVNASAHADKALGAQHKAFLLIRRLPLFEQVLQARRGMPASARVASRVWV